MRQQNDCQMTKALGYEHGRAGPFAGAVRATRIPMVITDAEQPDTPIVFCNEAFRKFAGYDRGEIIGTDSGFLQRPRTDIDGGC